VGSLRDCDSLKALCLVQTVIEKERRKTPMALLLLWQRNQHHDFVRARRRRIGGTKMESVTKAFICARESVVRNTGGQTMTEYALILAAIAVVVYGTYRALGNNISSLASGVDSTLTNA
jgi:Flp pilus assembly pilin Flp